eukprot:jgi/Mesvir1/17246/Mv07657-RA.1
MPSAARALPSVAVAAAVAPPCDPVALSSAVVALTSDPYMPVRAPVASPVDSGVIGASPRNPVVAMREYVAVPEVPVAPACDPIPTSVAPPVEPVATALSTGSASSSSGSVLPPPTAAVPLAGPTDAAAARSALPADGAGHSYRRLTALELAEQASGKKYMMHTMGCQMNLADSERMAGVLEEMGYDCTQDMEEADVVVLNTCSIRDKSEQKVYSALGRHADRRRANPDMRVVVAGCVAQQEGERLLRRVPEVDLVMGPQHVNRLAELLDQVDRGTQVCATEPIHILEDISVPRRDSKVTAWVNVIYGCNERCSYCVVPGVRGEEQSREPEAIRREMLAVAEAGYKEVTLLGQNIDAYGRDLPGFAPDGSGRRLWTFTDLLHYVADVPGLERLRFATSHRLIKACAELPNVCQFFHVPFQSGDDDILREMKRGYTADRYRRVVHMIRHYMPDAAISADAIVGFPGETEEQFMRTVNLIEELQLDMVNTAAYSPRPNTPAAEREDQIADLIKEDRLQRINRVVLDVAFKRSQRYLGREEVVLVEGINPKRPEQVTGRIENNRVTFFDGGADLVGKMVKVRITEARSFSLSAELLQVLS